MKQENNPHADDQAADQAADQASFDSYVHDFDDSDDISFAEMQDIYGSFIDGDCENPEPQNLDEHSDFEDKVLSEPPSLEDEVFSSDDPAAEVTLDDRGSAPPGTDKPKADDWTILQDSLDDDDDFFNDLDDGEEFSEPPEPPKQEGFAETEREPVHESDAPSSSNPLKCSINQRNFWVTFRCNFDRDVVEGWTVFPRSPTKPKEHIIHNREYKTSIGDTGSAINCRSCRHPEVRESTARIILELAMLKGWPLNQLKVAGNDPDLVAEIHKQKSLLLERKRSPLSDKMRKSFSPQSEASSTRKTSSTYSM